MQRALVIVSLVVGTGVLAATSGSEPRGPGRASEVSRLKSHFDSVDAELKSRAVSRLTPAQRSRRALLASWLRDYRNAGKFPVNDRLDAPAPFFRDSRGTLCAMAYLIEKSGRSDIVEKVEATRNNAYIGELADDPALIAWLDSSGLSVAEAARIQPTYAGEGLGLQRDFGLSPVWLGSASLATATLNVVRPSYVSGLLGIVVGAVSIGVAAKHIDDNSGTDPVAAALMGLGSLSFGTGVYGLLEARRDDRDSDRDRDRRHGRNRVSMRVAPDFDVRKSDARVGLRVVGKF